jgi:hypothetical protein
LPVETAWQKNTPLADDMPSQTLISFLLEAMQISCWSLFATFSQPPSWAWLREGARKIKTKNVLKIEKRITQPFKSWVML